MDQIISISLFPHLGLSELVKVRRDRVASAVALHSFRLVGCSIVIDGFCFACTSLHQSNQSLFSKYSRHVASFMHCFDRACNGRCSDKIMSHSSTLNLDVGHVTGLPLLWQNGPFSALQSTADEMMRPMSLLSF